MKLKPPPCKTCRGKCCYWSPIALDTWEKVKHLAPPNTVTFRKYEGTPAEAVFAINPESEPEGACAFLRQGRCAIYYRRPPSCRALGEIFPCPEQDPNIHFAYIEAAKKLGIELEGLKHG